MTSIFGKIRTDFKSTLQRLTTEHTAPIPLAVGVWLGITVGLTPLFGFHTFICLGLAHLFRLNKVVVCAASNISMPPLIPFIAAGAIEAGHWLRHGQWLTLGSHPILDLRDAFLADWLVGAVVGGLLIGAPFGLILANVAARRQSSLHRPAQVLCSQDKH